MTEQRTDRELQPTEDTFEKLASENTIPTGEQKGISIVAIGASAGGLDALQKLLPTLPKDIGIAYILAQHRASEQTNGFTAILKKYTQLSVEAVTDRTIIKPDVLYVSPPEFNIAYNKGQLRLFDNNDRMAQPGRRSWPATPSIDFFFNSLAREAGSRTIGIILSGTGSDGAHGIASLKACDGATIVQAPDTAKFPGMPEAALRTGAADLVLPPEKIGGELATLLRLVTTDLNELAGKESEPLILKEILTLLGKHARADFSGYKNSTIERRICRRAMLLGKSNLAEDLRFVTENNGELEILLKNLLISVTGFFRDKEAFVALEAALRAKLVDKKEGDTIRVWVPACSSGEEAYSIAIMLAEILNEEIKKYKIQIFATDIEDGVIQTARKGVYPLAAIAELDRELVDRYFTCTDNMAVIDREIREMVVLAKQDLLQDTPFLHLDLISCRNLMIYLESELQHNLLALFHFSLSPTGLLFLGTSESINKSLTLFSPINAKWKVYRRKESLTNQIPQLLQKRPMPQLSQLNVHVKRQERTELWKEREFATSLLNVLKCSALLVNEQGNINYIRGDVSDYLNFPEGSVKEQLNALSMAREEIRFILQSLLGRARKEQAVVKSQAIFFSDQTTRPVKIQIGPVDTAAESHFLVVFLRVESSLSDKPSQQHVLKEPERHEQNRIMDLEHELSATREHLQDMIEELVSNSEELQALNEELQATNEELQVSNEELGTSNEELQASNEELNTVNDELRSKSDELIEALGRLEQSEKRYRQLVHNANSVIIRWLADGAITFFNEYAETFFGYSAAEVLGRHISILLPHADSHGDDLTQLVQQVVANPLQFNHSVNENICKDGRRVWMTWTNKPIFKEDGTLKEILAVGNDITQLKKTEEQLRRRERDLSRSQNIAQVGSWRLNLETNDVSWTEELYKMYQCDPAQPPPPFPEHHTLFTPESWARLAPAVKETRTRGTPYELELEAVKLDGTHGWICAWGEAERDDQGAITGLWGAAQDITARKLAELEREQLAAQRQLALDAANLGWWHYDPKSRIASWNSRYAQIFGVSGDTRNNDEILDQIIHPEDLPEVQDRIQRALDPAVPDVFNAQYRIIRPDNGEVRWIEAHGILNPATAAPGRHSSQLVGTVADITDRKEAELALRASERRLALFIENAPVALAMFDRDIRYICWSRRWLEVFRINRRDIAGISHYELFPDLKENLKEIHRRTLAGEVMSAKDACFEHADGTVSWLNWEAQPWYDNTGEAGGIIIFAEDITGLKQAESEREKLHHQLTQAQKIESIGRLAGGVAHDYNNMLNVIIGYTDLAMEHVAPTDPLYENLTEISRAALRSVEVTRQLLAFARKQTAVPRLLDLNKTIDNSLKMLRRLIGENIELEWLPGPDLWTVKIDPGQVDQILANLCVNAHGAIANTGRVTIRTANRNAAELVPDTDNESPNSAEIEGDHVELRVSDTGCGIEKAIRDKIFEPFFTTKPLGQGTGLGLATVYGIVKQNNGTIEVDSSPGEGTTFTIRLPRNRATAEPATTDTYFHSGKEDETILVVEDEPAILKVTIRMLERQGYTVVAAQGPLEALKIAKEYPGSIELIISDVVMPAMNGQTMLAKIRQFRPGFRALFMSGYTADHIAQHGVLYEDVDFIQKPFTREQLGTKVRSLLERDGER